MCFAHILSYSFRPLEERDVTGLCWYAQHRCVTLYIHGLCRFVFRRCGLGQCDEVVRREPRRVPSVGFPVCVYVFRPLLCSKYDDVRDL